VILGVKTAQGLKGKVPTIKFVLPIEFWVFTFFTFDFCSLFNMMPSLMQLLRYEYETFEFFIKVYNFCGIGIFIDDPLKKIEFYLIHTYRSKVEI
jgi:hypothetical protein